MEEPNIELLERFVKGETSDVEEGFVKQWLSKNNLDARTLQQFIHLPNGTRVMLSLDKDKDWDVVRQKLVNRKQVFFSSPLFRVAAAIIFFISAISLFYYIKVNDTNSVAVYTIKNNEQPVKKYMLPDSSTVYLNEGTEVSYNETFTAERSVSIKGEAFFVVKRDSSKPFTIAVAQCKVQVLGTSFNVNEGIDNLEVIVATGKVSVQTPEQETVYLEKNEKALYTFSDKNLISEVNANPNYNSWQTGILQFQNTPLTDVVRDFEKHFKIRIDVQGSANSIAKYTSYFKNPTIAEVLEEMKEVLNITYTMQGKDVSLIIKQ